MILDILQLRNPAHVAVLRASSEPVTVFNQDLVDFCNNMVETMYAANGVGLAAPQVGLNQNIFVMRTVESLEAGKDRGHLILINPTHNLNLDATYYDVEGCLSFPGIQGKVKRSKDLATAHMTPEGTFSGGSFSGLQARIYQHEEDHLRGIMFIDKAEEFYQLKKR